KAVATDSSGISNTSTNITVTIGSETTENFSITDVPGSSGGNVDATFSGSYGINNVRLYLVKNNGNAVLVGNMFNIGGTYRAAWIPGGPGKYKFFAIANINGSTGLIKTNNSSEVTVN